MQTVDMRNMLLINAITVNNTFSAKDFHTTIRDYETYFTVTIRKGGFSQLIQISSSGTNKVFTLQYFCKYFGCVKTFESNLYYSLEDMIESLYSNYLASLR